MAAKYIRLANTLKELLSSYSGSGSFRLPSEHDLSVQYGVSRQTVRHSLALLEKEGLIEKKKGSGSWTTGLSANPADNQIAILISSSNEYIYPALLSDIRDALEEKGYTIRIFETGNRVSAEREILKELLDSSVRGIIVEGCTSTLPDPNLDLYEQLQHNQVSILFLHAGYAALEHAICIEDDNFAGGYFLGHHLITRNHRKIAGIFKIDDMQGPERYAGWLAAMSAAELELPDNCTVWFTEQELRALRQKQDTRFLRAFINGPLRNCTAVICYNDEIAYWLIRELKRANLQIPRDISVVCFDNSYLSEISDVRLTSLSHKPHETGTAAAQTMLKMIQGIPVTSRKIPWELVIRESVRLL